MFDGKAFGQEMVGIVKAHIERVVAPLNSRIADLEKQLAEMPTPKDADVDEVAALAAASILPDIMDVRSMVEALPTMPDVPALIAEAIASIPVPEKGKDADPDLIKTMIADAVAALPSAEKGKDADPAETEEMVVKHVERVLAGWERPKNGVDGKDGAPGADGKDGAPGKDGLDGKDGRNGLDAVKFFRDDKGHLIVVKSDGSTDDLGEYVGKDGAPGRDGADGVGFDDMSCEVRDDGVYLVWEKGDIVKEARLPVPIYRGVFKEGTAYLAGDNVSFGGSVFIAERATSAKPETPDSGWRLSVKRGRDGKDAIPAKPKKGS
jgi:hypothetical protein